jgi:hypothetical protein
MTMPDGRTVVMWGFGLDGDNNFATPDYTVRVPGPVLTVPPGDNTLTVHLKNMLGEPVSLNILGQPLAANAGPVWTDGLTDTVVATGARPAGNFTARVRSFAHEAAANGGEADYTWGTGANPFRVGTYLLQSGTNPAKQVQMGLYAAVKKDAADGAYGAASAYAKELVLVFSEIDPAIHDAVDQGNFGPGKAVPSANQYQARYFLINGKSYPAGLDPLNGCVQINGDEVVLLRFLNAGLETHVPWMLFPYLTLVAEDGRPHAFTKQQVSIELAASKTVDALITFPTPAGANQRHPLLDRRLNLTNAGQGPGGMLAFLWVGALPPDTQAPVTSNLAATPNPTLGAGLVTLTATADDEGSGCSNIAAAEYFIDVLGAAGTGTPMNAADGAFDSPVENLIANVDVSGLAPGPHTLYVRSQDSSGNWESTGTIVICVGSPDTVSITKIRYKAKKGKLKIWASSTAQGAALTAEGIGPLQFRKVNNGLSLYKGNFKGVTPQPASITVTSSFCGTDTQAVPFP